MNNNQDDQDILTNLESETTTEETQVESQDDAEDSIEALKSQIGKLQENYENQKIRAEKAESKLKHSDSKPVTNKDNLSAMDIIAMTRANIDDEGIAEVLEYAKFKKISVSEAINSPIIKAAQAQRAEFKRTAEASNTGSGRRGTSRVGDDILLENARKGIMPDSEIDMERLLKLRQKK